GGHRRRHFLGPVGRCLRPSRLLVVLVLDLLDHLPRLDHRVDQQPYPGQGADAAQALAEQRQKCGGGKHPRCLARLLIPAGTTVHQLAEVIERVAQRLGVVQHLLAVHLHAQPDQLLVLIHCRWSAQGFVHGNRRSRLRAISSRVSWNGRAWLRTWLFALPKQMATPMAYSTQRPRIASMRCSSQAAMTMAEDRPITSSRPNTRPSAA